MQTKLSPTMLESAVSYYHDLLADNDILERSRQMFDDSLHAALSLEEIRGFVVQLGFPAESVQQTTDRHWTWIGKKVV